jgi:5-methylcytosine-specific restriction endonuclease McrA
MGRIYIPKGDCLTSCEECLKKDFCIKFRPNRNKDSFTTYLKEYYIKNKEQIRVANKAYYDTHFDEISKRRKTWRLKHGEYLNLKMKEYYSTSMGRYSKTKTSAKKREILFLMTPDEFIPWYESTPKYCFYCGATFTKGQQMTKETIDRVDNAKPYTIDNIVLCCGKCNAVKGSWFTKEQMIEIAHKYFIKVEKKEVSNE